MVTFNPTATAQSMSAADVVTARRRTLLVGKVGGVIGGLRQMQTKHRFATAKVLTAAIGYFDKNAVHVSYDQYLAAGTCRDLVKRPAGTNGGIGRWPGPRAMLHLRATYLKGDWDGFEAGLHPFSYTSPVAA